MFKSRKSLSSGTSKSGPKRKRNVATFGCILLLGSAATLFLMTSNDYSHFKVVYTNSLLDTAISHNESKLMEASDDQVLESLLQLARMPVKELQKVLETGEGSRSGINPFQLHQLQAGICPTEFSGTIPWLPRKKSQELSQRLISGQNYQKPVVAIYYEHLSKAGGTSFCTLANANMPKNEVPSYYCMPRNARGGDARISTWTMHGIEEFFLNQTNRIVSSEWEPFNLQLQHHFSPERNDRVQLIFVTTIRNPINRILSSYKFFALANNPKTTLAEWISECAPNSKTWTIVGKESYRKHLCRFNFAIWKFSGGALPIAKSNGQITKWLQKEPTREVLENKLLTEDQWKQPFETAIRTLIDFDLVIPMEQMSHHTEPLTEVLGWTNFSQTHVVTTGKIVNHTASSELNPDVYDTLWQCNGLDMILYYWSLAVYLTRLHCKDLL